MTARFLGLLSVVVLAAIPAVANEPLAVRPADPAVRWSPCPPVFPAGCELTVLHGDPARPNADVFLRVPANYEIPPHTHTSAERMTLSAGRLRVKYRGAAEVELTPGTYAYGPAGLPHRARCVSAEPCVLFIAFEGPVDAVAHAGPLD